MSFKARYKTKIKDVNREFLKESVSMMVKELELQLWKNTEFNIWNGRKIPVSGICFKDHNAMYPVDLRINEKNELEIQCDSSDRSVYEKYMKRVQEQFYPGVVISHKTRTPVKYDKETEKLTLMITR